MNCLFTKIRNVILLLALMTLCGNKAFALRAGDLLFTSYSSKATAGSDTFTFVLMTAVPSSTVINFTDRGYGGSSFNADNGASETSISWNTGTNALPVGTEVLIKGLTAVLVSTGASVGTVTAITGTVGLSLTGADQIIAYQGTIGSSPTLIAGIHWNNCSGTTTNAGWDPTSCPTVTGVSGSTMPPGLREDSSAMWAGVTAGVARIGAKFNCVNVPTSDINVMRAAILNNANWSSTTTTSGALDLPPGCTYFGAAAPTINTDPTNRSICAGTATTFGITQTGGTTIKWQVNTGSGFTNITDGGVYSGSSTVTLSISSGVTAAYNGYQYRAYVSNAGGGDTSTAALLTVASGVPTFSVQPNDAAICAGGSTTLSSTASTTGTPTYKWQVDNGTGFANINDGGVYSNTATASLTITGATTGMYGYKYRLSVTNACGTAYSNAATLTFSNTWTGTTSTNWNTAGNWSCNAVPDTLTDVVINTGSNQPSITATAYAHDINIGVSGTLTVGTNGVLNVKGDITNIGGFTASASGATVNFINAVDAQNVPSGTYTNMTITGGVDKTLSGAATVNGTLTFANNTRLQLGNNTLTMGASAAFSGVSASTYVVTNGTGALKRNSVGSTSVSWPVGSARNYTPATISNTGTTDNISVRVIDSVYPNYSGETPVGAGITSRVISKTWFITEDVNGGTNATLTLQWNTADELTFNRNKCFISHYVSGAWSPSSATLAGGSNPYTQTTSGITSFSPFGVGNITSPLPLTLLSFNGNREGKGVSLKWETANEANIADFGIERSVDGNSFKTIGSVASTKSSEGGINKYQYYDNNLPAVPSSLYYRLKMGELDGQYNYSNTITLYQGSDANTPYVISPNPVNGDELYIRSAVKVTGNMEVSITDMGGKQFYRNVITNPSGDVQPVSVKGIPAGIYLLKIHQDGTDYTVKMVRH